MPARHPLPRAQPAEFDLFLRVRHPHLDPALISQELQLRAEHSFRAGEARELPGSAASVHTESCWLASLHPLTWPANRVESPAARGARAALDALGVLQEAGVRDLSIALSMCVMMLRRHGEFLRRIVSEGGQIQLRVAFDGDSGMSFTLSPQHMAILSELSIALEIDASER